MTAITKTQLKAMYKAAAERAVPCSNGVAFSVEDRVNLNSARKALNLDCSQAGELMAGGRGDRNEYQRHYARFNFWSEQVETGVIRIAPPATGEHVGKVHVTKKHEATFDGRIKTRDDIQPAFTRAARQLVDLGITNAAEVMRYINVGFATVKVEKKIDIKADRILNELRLDMDSNMARLVLDRVKSQL